MRKKETVQSPEGNVCVCVCVQSCILMHTTLGLGLKWLPV